jgi:hypothetical protein
VFLHEVAHNPQASGLSYRPGGTDPTAYMRALQAEFAK